MGKIKLVTLNMNATGSNKNVRHDLVTLKCCVTTITVGPVTLIEIDLGY